MLRLDLVEVLFIEQGYAWTGPHCVCGHCDIAHTVEGRIRDAAEVTTDVMGAFLNSRRFMYIR